MDRSLGPATPCLHAACGQSGEEVTVLGTEKTAGSCCAALSWGTHTTSSPSCSWRTWQPEALLNTGPACSEREPGGPQQLLGGGELGKSGLMASDGQASNRRASPRDQSQARQLKALVNGKRSWRDLTAPSPRTQRRWRPEKQASPAAAPAVPAYPVLCKSPPWSSPLAQQPGVPGQMLSLKTWSLH